MPKPSTPAAPAAMPEVRGGPAPYIQVDGADTAAAWYAKAFGAQEVFRQPVDEKGRTMHIHLYINGGSFMLTDAYPEHGHPSARIQGCMIHLQVDDVDAWWARAIDAGATANLEPQVMFWGDYYGMLADPFGLRWSLGGPTPVGAS